MLGVTPETLRDLRKPTPREEIKQRKVYLKNQRVAQNADGTDKMLDYIDARYVQDTLDEVVGPENWQAEFRDTEDGQGVRCRLGIRVQSGDDEPVWVWKEDVGTESTIEPLKGMHSDALKRAAVHWGIARDLYDARAEERPSQVGGQDDQPGQRQPIRTRVSATVVSQNPMGQDDVDVDEENAPWACPTHGEVKVVPAGISRRTQKPYNAFYACPVRDCDQKGPSIK